MKRILSIVLVLAMMLSLAACAGGNTTTTAAPQTTATAAPETTQDVLVEALNFLQEGEIYFDIHLSADTVKDLSITVDGKALGSDKKLRFKEGSSYEVKGEGKDGVKVVTVIVSSTKDGNHFRNTHEISSGNVSDALELLGRKLSRAKGQKLYVFFAEKKGDWDHNLGNALNQYMEKVTVVLP